MRERIKQTLREQHEEKLFNAICEFLKQEMKGYPAVQKILILCLGDWYNICFLVQQGGNNHEAHNKTISLENDLPNYFSLKGVKTIVIGSDKEQMFERTVEMAKQSKHLHAVIDMTPGNLMEQPMWEQKEEKMLKAIANYLKQKFGGVRRYKMVLVTQLDMSAYSICYFLDDKEPYDDAARGLGKWVDDLKNIFGLTYLDLQQVNSMKDFNHAFNLKKQDTGKKHQLIDFTSTGNLMEATERWDEHHMKKVLKATGMFVKNALGDNPSILKVGMIIYPTRDIVLQVLYKLDAYNEVCDQVYPMKDSIREYMGFKYVGVELEHIQRNFDDTIGYYKAKNILTTVIDFTPGNLNEQKMSYDNKMMKAIARYIKQNLAGHRFIKKFLLTKYDVSNYYVSYFWDDTVVVDIPDEDLKEGEELTEQIRINLLSYFSLTNVQSEILSPDHFAETIEGRKARGRTFIVVDLQPKPLHEQKKDKMMAAIATVCKNFLSPIQEVRRFMVADVNPKESVRYTVIVQYDYLSKSHLQNLLGTINDYLDVWVAPMGIDTDDAFEFYYEEIYKRYPHILVDLTQENNP